MNAKPDSTPIITVWPVVQITTSPIDMTISVLCSYLSRQTIMASCKLAHLQAEGRKCDLDEHYHMDGTAFICYYILNHSCVQNATLRTFFRWYSVYDMESLDTETDVASEELKV